MMGSSSDGECSHTQSRHMQDQTVSMGDDDSDAEAPSHYSNCHSCSWLPPWNMKGRYWPHCFNSTPQTSDTLDNNRTACDKKENGDKKLVMLSLSNLNSVNDLQHQLRTALINSQYPKIKEIVTGSRVDLEYVYQDYKTCLEIAVSEPNKKEYVTLLLECGNIEDTFKNLLKDKRVNVNIKGINNTPLLMVFKKMRNLDGDQTSTDISPDEHDVTPIFSAAEQGLKTRITMLMNKYHYSIDTLLQPVTGETLLQATIRGMGCSRNPNADFNWCLDFFIEKSNVNHSDKRNNTALHYAGKNGDDETVLKLLRHGACVSLRDEFNKLAISNINAKTLQTYLDECITTKLNDDYRPNDADYGIQMQYDFLIDSKQTATEFGSETDALVYMTKYEEFRPLLDHPVITSFLYLKWHHGISGLSYVNITFYTIMWLCLNLYIVLGYCEEKKQSNFIEALNIITYIGAIIGLIILIIREIFQVLLSPVRYAQGFDNWMEIALIFVAAWIVFYDSTQDSTKQQLSAIAILLSSTELVLLIGKFPASSTNVVMLKTVSWNFFKFLLWYCILIIAFALSFYTLFRQVGENQSLPSSESPLPNLSNTGKEESDYFKDPGRALFKTIVMLTGEFDAGSIEFSTFPVTSHIIFILFVFMIPIVLFNLLNGLAVSDTQTIRADAELIGLVSRIQHISYVESVLIGNARSYYTTSKFWSYLITHLQNINTRLFNFKMFCRRPFAKRISLFPDFLPKCMIIIKPNQGNKIEIPSRDDQGGGRCLGPCQNYKLDQKIVRNAKRVISKKINFTELEKLATKIEDLAKTIKSLETALNKVCTLERL